MKLPKFSGAAALFLKRAAIVAGFTGLSRLTGFARDVVLAKYLGASGFADAFFIAQRLPNHFRTLFAEGAFNASFLPTYAETLTKDGQQAALGFAARVIGALLMVQIIILAAAEIWTRDLLTLIAPGFTSNPGLGDLTVTLTRITFPYLALVTAVTVYGAILNAHQRFAAAAAAPILLNVAIVGTVALYFLFPSAGHAAAWGVFLAGILELALLVGGLWVAGLRVGIQWPRLDAGLRTMLRRLGPATIGSGSAQIALFVDTILAAALPLGAVSALYYADRLYQLPIGVIGIAIGTVLLPDLARRFAAGDETGARRAQNRAILWTLCLTAPFAIVFLAVPHLLMQIVFVRGAFDEVAAARSALALRAYAVGLIAIVMLRPVVAGFHARGDTRTPMFVAFAGLGVNLALKLIATRYFDVAGLALATSAGAWVNVLLLLALRHRMPPPAQTGGPVVVTANGDG